MGEFMMFMTPSFSEIAKDILTYPNPNFLTFCYVVVSNIFYFHHYLGFHDPIWLMHIF